MAMYGNLYGCFIIYILILFSKGAYFSSHLGLIFIQGALNWYPLDISYGFSSTMCYYNTVVKLIIAQNNVNAFICGFGRKQNVEHLSRWIFYYNKCQSDFKRFFTFIFFSKPLNHIIHFNVFMAIYMDALL